MIEAKFYRKQEEDKVRCLLCPHRCLILPGKRGLCGVRENSGGILYSLVYQKAISAHVDPIEKKPLFHFLPGSTSFSVATVGCNLSCRFCQNSDISQAGKETVEIDGYDLPPAEVVRRAKQAGCLSISYTYTEPTVFFEYAFDTAVRAKKEGLANNFVTNGYIEAEPLKAIAPYLDAANVDLKSFREEYYRKICGGSLKPVLDTLILMKERNLWVEVTTLVLPGLNDSDAELQDIAFFIRDNLGPDTPWHISRFFPRYRMDASSPTPPETIDHARQIGLDAGLRFVYSGNLDGGSGESTFCSDCGKAVISRFGFALTGNKIAGGCCSFCGAKIAGVFVY
ncbi:MAG: AmmeMemoRadiSam system radical SAM enzyme [Candidatus Omnitrophica bacterium]|nr:AmmeMemoRadiSam system radical SAM enzyme [Candidatus Omnitrophota bacterium]